MEIKDIRINRKRHRHFRRCGQNWCDTWWRVQRLTLTDGDNYKRDFFVIWLNGLDLEIIIDEMGNIFGKRSGKSHDL